jgi:tetratricopeptide (TPR) repeat protein
MRKQPRLLSALRTLAASFCFFSAITIAAVGASLNVGDKAPPLKTTKWLKGEPVSQLAEGTVYLINFWASWSAPCRDSMPQVNDIYQKFKTNGLIVIGQNCWEQDEAAATAFVKEMNIVYPVALDDESRSMARNWMSAAGRSSVPTAFVIDKKGKIAWVGNPIDLKEQVIADVLAGKFEIKPAAQPPFDRSPLAETEDRLNNMIAQFGSNSTEAVRALVERAHVRGRTKRWKEASADLKQALQINPTDHWSWYLLTPVLIQTGDFAEYQKHSHQILIHFGGTSDAYVAGRAAEGCLLLPGASTNDLELAAQIVPRKISQHWRRFFVGLVDYRRGRFDSAADWMEKIRADLDSVTGPDRWSCEADTYFILAMARHQLKQPEKAREALSHAKEVIDSVLPKFDGPDLGRYWWDVLTTHIIARQAVELIEKPPDDLLAEKSEIKPPAPSVPDKNPLAEKEEPFSNIIAQAGSNSVETANAFVRRAELRARARHWKEAAFDLKQAIRLNPSEPWPWYILTPLLLQTDDFASFQTHSHEILLRFGQTENALIAGRAAEGCLLSAKASTNDVELATKILPRKIFPHWRRFYVGLAEYRLGRFTSAAHWMEQIRNDLDSINNVDRWPCEADACLVLAMAQHQLKQTEKAQETFSHAKEIIDTVMPKFDGPDLGGHWWNVLTTHIFAKEATELIEKSQGASSGP